MPIAIDTLRAKVEETYIGFRPNTAKVKPVHIANGLFRVVLGRVADTDLLNRFVITQSRTEVPEGHQPEVVYSELRDADRLDPVDVTLGELNRLRVLLKKVVAADDAVFPKGMASYTAGNQGFVSKDHIGQDGGEFVAEWLERRAPGLSNCVSASLSESDDIISLLSSPLLSGATKLWEQERFDPEKFPFLTKPRDPQTKELWTGLADAAETLAAHLVQHPNKLLRLRLAVMFSCFVLFRYLASLEASKADNSSVPPLFLFDFSSTASTDPIARASSMTFMAAGQSIARFYAWAFAEQLRSEYTAKELAQEPTPTYGAKGKVSEKTERDQKKKNDEARQVWELAVQAAKRERSPFRVYGGALYDILALQTEGNPVTYMKKLGLLAGWLYPPNQPAPRFVAKQDLLEVLVRGAIQPGQSMNLSELLDIFWKRYRIVIGGRPEDEERLVGAGIYQADGDALVANRAGFVDALGRLSFASLLADGVLQVSTEERE